MKVEWRKEKLKRFEVLHRDEFTCRYCGARPGSEFLEVDHLVPRAKHGTDDASNLVTACKTCNARKSDAIVFPHDLIECVDGDGWFVHRTFGCWSIVFCSDRIGIENSFGYGFLDAYRWPDSFWWAGLSCKAWPDVRICELEQAVAHLSRLVCLPEWVSERVFFWSAASL